MTRLNREDILKKLRGSVEDSNIVTPDQMPTDSDEDLVTIDQMPTDSDEDLVSPKPVKKDLLPSLSLDEVNELRRRGVPETNVFKKRPIDPNSILNDVPDSETEYVGSPNPDTESFADISKGLEMQEALKAEQIGRPVEGGLLQSMLPGKPVSDHSNMSLLELARNNADVKDEPRVMGLPIADVQKAIQKIKGIPLPKRAPATIHDPLVSVSPEPNTFDSRKELIDAQRMSNENNLLTNLARAGMQIGAGIGHSKADYSTIDEIAKGNNQPVENYKQRQAGKASDMKLTEADMDLTNQKALQDPNSPISVAARQAANKALRLNLPDNVSAALLDKAGLLKSLIAGLNPAGNSRQVIRQMQPDGSIVNILLNKLTGEQEILGETGFAGQTRIDPRTGEAVQIIPSRITNNVTKLQEAQPSLQGSPAAQQAVMLGQQSSLPQDAAQVEKEEPIKLNVRQQEKISDMIKQTQTSDEFKAAEKIVMQEGKIRKLLKDVSAHGGQSLAMLGPIVARGIASEVGVLTEQDVTRYIRNPTLLGGLQDTFLKLTQGKLSAVSVDNLNRLLDIMSEEARNNRNTLYDQAATQLNRLYGIPKLQAISMMNPHTSLDGRPSTGRNPSNIQHSDPSKEERRQQLLQTLHSGK